MEAKKVLNKIIHLVNPDKKEVYNHYTPVMHVQINGRLGKAKFHSLSILLDFGESSYIVIGKYTKTLRNKNTHPVT